MQVRWTSATVTAKSGSTVTVGTPNEHGTLTTLELTPPHVQPHFLPDVGATVRLLMVGPVPFLYPDAIAEDAITAREIIAGSVTALLVQGDTIIAGAPLGANVTLKSDGVRVNAFDSDLGQYEASRWGTSMDDFWSITNAAGVVSASVSAAGAAQFSALSTTAWPQVGAGDWSGVGGRLDEILDRRPRGLLGWVAVTANGPVTATTIGWNEFRFTLYPSRTYRLSGVVRLKSTVAADVAQAQVRFTSAAAGTTPAQPVVGSALLTKTTELVDATARNVHVSQTFTLADLALTVPSELRFLICYSRITGTGNVSGEATATEAARLVLEDLGVGKAATSTVVNDGAGGGGSAPSTLRTLTVQGSWTNSYSGNGDHRTAATTAWQGHKVIFGMRKSMIGFPSLTQLTGATINSVTLRLNATQWAGTAGGTAVVGFHAYLAQPSGSLPGLTSYTADVNRTGIWTGLGTGYVNLTGHAPQEWATGVKRGIYLGLAQGVIDTADQISGAFSGSSDPTTTLRPELTFTYTV